MKLVLLGTSGYHPNERRHTPCFMIPECGIVLDAGTAMFRVGQHLATPYLDIFLTHAHLDHVIGLTYLLNIIYRMPVERVTVYAKADKLRAIDEHLFAEDLFPAKPPYESLPLEGPVALAGGGKLTHFSLEHAGGSTGFRLDWPDRSMAYVTDTTASLDAPYVEKIRGVDLLVHECYWPDARMEEGELYGHSCITPVAQVAKKAGVGRLILVHVDPMATGDDPVGIDRGRAIFPSTELGHDRMEVEF